MPEKVEIKVLEMHQMIYAMKRQQMFIAILSTISIVFVSLLAVVFVVQSSRTRDEIIVNRNLSSTLGEQHKEILEKLK